MYVNEKTQQVLVIHHKLKPPKYLMYAKLYKAGCTACSNCSIHHESNKHK